MLGGQRSGAHGRILPRCMVHRPDYIAQKMKHNLPARAENANVLLHVSKGIYTDLLALRKDYRK